ncbi:MAG: InlB B-repeat-containing protein, partial [Oscillospiraceae bacterium]
ERGTGNGGQFGGVPLIGKTGTTSDNKDLWFVGSSAYYSAAVWWGFDEPKEMAFRGHPSLAMWKNVMERVHKGLPIKNFTQPEDVQVANYCTDTGLIATEICPKPMLGYYKKGTLPELCTNHIVPEQEEPKEELPPNKEDQEKPPINNGENDNDTPKPPTRYTLRFNTDGGTGISSVSAEEGEIIKLDTKITTKDGYDFDGWYDQDDKKVSVNFKITNKNVILKAKWIKK